MNAISKPAMFAHAAVLSRDFVQQPPRCMDRVTFNTPDDGMLAGYVAMITQHIGNGQKFAWIELDNAPPGSFRGVPLNDIISSDDCGSARRGAAFNRSSCPLYLADFSNVLIGMTCAPIDGIENDEHKS